MTGSFCSALVNTDDTSLGFLVQNPISAMLAVQVSEVEYLLAFNSKLINILKLALKI